MKFIIISPEYTDKSGGIIVMHKLCDILNRLGFPALMHPITTAPEPGLKNGVNHYIKKLKFLYKRYRTHPQFNSPIIRYISKKDTVNSIFIYPEVVSGNPMNAHHIARWLLHQPGFHTGEINYGPGEIYFKFNSAINDFNYPGSVTSKNEMKVIHYPIDIYNLQNTNSTRDIVSCHMIRKGGYKPIVHDSDSIPLDGLSHKEIADIFKRAQKFICYDDYTAYSIFAVLCGCQSIVVPEKNKSLEEWYPKIEDRYGICYGLSEEQVNWASNTKHKVLQHIMNEHQRSEINVRVCANEMLAYFSK